MAAVPVVASNQVKVGSTAAATASVAKPASLAAGELVLVFVISADNTGGPCFTSSVASGLIELAEVGDAVIDTRCWAGGKIATASEPDSYFVESSCGSDEYVCWSVRVTGNHLSNWFNAATTRLPGADSLAIVITGVNSILDSCLAFYLASFDGGDGDPFTVAGTGWSETAENASGTSTTTSVGGAWGTKSMANKGATGNATVDATGATSDGWSGLQVVIHGTDSREMPQVMSVTID